MHAMLTCFYKYFSGYPLFCLIKAKYAKSTKVILTTNTSLENIFFGKGYNKGIFSKAFSYISITKVFWMK